MVYIGTIEYRFRNMKMFHMAATDIEELHQMADKIGIRRGYFQNKELHPHYDISKTKKILAIKNGAIEMNDRELIKICFPNANWPK